LTPQLPTLHWKGKVTVGTTKQNKLPSVTYSDVTNK